MLNLWDVERYTDPITIKAILRIQREELEENAPPENLDNDPKIKYHRSTGVSEEKIQELIEMRRILNKDKMKLKKLKRYMLEYAPQIKWQRVLKNCGLPPDKTSEGFLHIFISA